MDKFKPALPVLQGVQNGQVEGLKVSAASNLQPFAAVSSEVDAFEVRQAAQEALVAGLVARLQRGEAVFLGRDWSPQYRGPAPGEHGTLYLPAGRTGRP